MKTRLLDSLEWQEVLPSLKNLDPVVIPTETVYGLAAFAESDDACKKIFYIKSRPADNPLIVHCSSKNMAKRYMAVDSNKQKQASDLACAIFEQFSPGPITCVVYASSLVCETVRAGTDTVALRIPDHTLFLCIIKKCDVALAAPSANLSGQPSPTNALMAWNYMANKVPAILDGGYCRIGLESTIVDCRDSDKIQILRPGFISANDIEEKMGLEVEDPFSSESDLQTNKTEKNLRFPGLQYRHYAPNAKVVPVLYEESKRIFWIRGLEYRAQDFSEFTHELSAVTRKPMDRTTSSHSSQENPLSLSGIIIGPVDHNESPKLQRKLVEEGWQMVRVFTSWQKLEQLLFAYFSESDSYNLRNLYVLCPSAQISSALHNRINKAADT